MTTVDLNRLKGNYSQNTVSALLSRTCLVRPVAEGTDIGVDLYCESVLSHRPHLHFWAQVKTINSTQIVKKDGQEVAWFDFDTHHLRYWAQQPIPVYAFLVPVEGWPPDFPTRIYGVRITEYVVKNEIPNQSTVRLYSAGCFDVKIIDDDLTQFITQIVPWDTSALLIQKGIIAPIVDMTEASENRFPKGIGFRHLDKIIANIRDASVMGLIDSLVFEQVQPEKKLLRQRFEQVAKVFEDQMHVFGLSVLVRAAHSDGNLDKAKQYIYDAITRIEQDQTIPEDVKLTQITKIRILLNDFE
jgi:hypothetical protein